MFHNTVTHAEHSPLPGPLPEGETGYISLPTRFDVMSSAQYRMPFSRMLGDPTKFRVVVNMSGVTYIDSSGVGTLIAWHKTCKEFGKELVMQNCGHSIMDIFKMLAVDQLFSFA